MRTRLAQLWNQLSGSYWFVPSLLAVTAVALALGMERVDRLVEGSPGDFMGPLYGGEPDSARTILSTVASALINVVSLTFSVTVVALTLAANQFGPRLLYNFMHDRSNQVVLGIFIGTFIYCLLVLRMVGDGSASQVPHVSVLVGLGLGIISVGVLIYFIHHIVETIQANNVVARVATELTQTVARVFPERDRTPRAPTYDEHILHLLERPAGELRSRREGVLQSIDQAGLLKLACRYDVVVRLLHRPGEFVLRDSVTFQIWPAERVSDELERACSRTLLVGARRTLVQDVEFAFDQLVELALRALSPSLNDAFTATACIERLGAGLAEVARRAPQASVVHDAEGEPRVVLKTYDFPSLCKRAFDQIRQSARDNLAVLLRLLEIIDRVLRQVTRPEQREALESQARMIYRDARCCAITDEDSADVERRYRSLRTGSPTW